MNKQRAMFDRKQVKCGVYGIRNMINHKIYIGSSKNIYSRWNDHISALKRNKHHNIHLQNSWNKYGCDNFQFFIIEECEQSIRYVYEQQWYDFYKTEDRSNVYNTCDIVLGCDKHYRFSLNDIENGRSIMNIDEFYQILDYLENTDLSIPKISKIVGVPQTTIYSIYFKEEYKQITENMSFIKRKYGGTHALTPDMAMEIIKRLQNGEYQCDIARDMGVSSNTVSDIRNYHTWKEYTRGIIFPEKSARHQPSKHRKKVYQYDYDGNLLNIYDSITFAGEMSRVNFQDISSCCRGKLKSAGKFVWRFENDAFNKYDLPEK